MAIAYSAVAMCVLLSILTPVPGRGLGICVIRKNRTPTTEAGVRDSGLFQEPPVWHWKSLLFLISLGLCSAKVGRRGGWPTKSFLTQTNFGLASHYQGVFMHSVSYLYTAWYCPKPSPEGWLPPSPIETHGYLKHHTAKPNSASSPNLRRCPLHSPSLAWESFLILPSPLHPIRYQICPPKSPHVSELRSLLSSSPLLSGADHHYLTSSPVQLRLT